MVLGGYMGEYLKDEIMRQSRHQFIYGYDNEGRSLFSKSLEGDFDVVVGIDKPIAIYMKDYYFPRVELSSDVDLFRLHQVHREYFNLALIKNIISRVKLKSSLLDDENVLKFLRSLSIVTSDDSSYTSLDDFEKDLISSLEFYSLYHDKLVSKDDSLPSIQEVKVPFIMPDMIVPKIKKMLVNNSYFGIIVDKNINFSIDTHKMINSYVTRRINSDLSMKVVTDPEKWMTYYDNSGQYAESVHDYGVVEFDNSYSEYTKKLMKRYEIK